MASLPARQPSQRRVSPSEQTSNSQNQQTQSSPSPVRTRSEDSQTVFLNTPDSPHQDQATSEQPEQPTQTDNSAAIDDASVKKCWICFSDSTEDTLETSPWRSPCPCALVAHEECLLDWIADMESPTNTRKNNHNGIQCPQCKKEIKLARPRNYVVEAVRRLEKVGNDLIYPGAGTVLFASAYNASMAWGIHSIYAVFGAEDGFRILRPLILNHVRPPLEFQNTSVRAIGNSMLALAVNHVQHWRLYVGLPLITPIVILSRTTYADSVLPVLPVLFFATQNVSGSEPLDFNTWPPSAGLAFSLLPYLRLAYNSYYRKVWEPKEKQWLAEIQPRARERLDSEGNPLPPNIDPDEEPLIEVRLDVDDWDSEDEEEEVQQAMAEAAAASEAAANEEGAAPSGRAPPPTPESSPPEVLQGGGENAHAQADGQDGHEEQANDAEAAPAPVVGLAPNQQPQQAGDPAVAAAAAEAAQPDPAAAAGAAPVRRDAGAAIRLTPFIEATLGALLFPTIASMSGELLKLALPRAWTTAPSPGIFSRGSRLAGKGLLQEKWGRSLVGGCLFVVFKDAVMLYVRWKMAQMHRKRRVLDWEGKRVVS